ncbi:hypothetical protein B0T20DRAFT_418296 [Sordaria brevicollis]|uniref:Uncharacterized protein n=1 Tax=Sordaria brevicollis TaxID=83679 RepID=A0AAE0UAP8_SORBR|nr:hypothetical protein B0T20DRAFT_418296 [Sordaria brevicollis]
MHPALLLLSILTWGVSNLPFGAAAPLLSPTSSSPKEHSLNLPHLERELPNPSLLLHGPQVTKRWEHYLPTEASPTEVKRSEVTPHLTPRLHDDLPVEERSASTRGEEQRGWSAHQSRDKQSSESVETRDLYPTPDPMVKDITQFNHEVWVFIGVAGTFAFFTFLGCCAGACGGKDTLECLKSLPPVFATCCRCMANKNRKIAGRPPLPELEKD